MSANGHMFDVTSYKVTVIGDCQVGKTALVRKFLDPLAALDLIQPSRGISVEFKVVSLDDKRYRLSTFDVSGLESWLSFTESVYRRSDAFILVYDVTRRDTFHDLDRHLEKAIRFRGHDVPMVLVGNKCDVIDQRLVPFEDAARFTEQHGMVVMETSARDMYNVEQIFVTAVCEARDWSKRVEAESDRRVRLTQNPGGVPNKCWR